MDEELKYACDLIRNTVSAIDVGIALGLNPGHDGRCRCFLHGGDNRNLKLYRDPGRGFYCFVCHEYGDVIRLVMKRNDCSFLEAVEWLNDSFGLHLNLRKDDPYSRRRRAETYARKIAKERNNGRDFKPSG